MLPAVAHQPAVIISPSVSVRSEPAEASIVKGEEQEDVPQLPQIFTLTLPNYSVSMAGPSSIVIESPSVASSNKRAVKRKRTSIRRTLLHRHVTSKYKRTVRGERVSPQPEERSTQSPDPGWTTHEAIEYKKSSSDTTIPSSSTATGSSRNEEELPQPTSTSKRVARRK